MKVRYNMSHTKGTWKIRPEDDYYIYSEDITIAKVFLGKKDNAQLISASPDLLRAGKQIINAILDNIEENDYPYIKLQYIADELEELQKAIIKAEGIK
jgi:hypothetical protein